MPGPVVHGSNVEQRAAPAGEPWDVESSYASYRAYLVGLAYRLLGSVSDAEDVVHELYASMLAERPASVSHLKAYLTKAVTHRCLNLRKSAAKRRVSYVGEWLPEPWIEPPGSIADDIERRDEVSYAFLVMLEKLTPLERAVLVLREALDYEYEEIAGILDRSEAACRQLLSRAKKKLGPGGRRPDGRRPGERAARAVQATPFHPPGEQQRVQRWVSALSTGNIDEILDLIAEDAVLVTDGGGKVLAAINPIYGRRRAAALLKAMANRKYREARLYPARVNGAWGVVAVQGDEVIGVGCFDWNADGTAQHVYFVFNPDKLGRAAPPVTFPGE